MITGLRSGFKKEFLSVGHQLFRFHVIGRHILVEANENPHF